MHFMIKLTDNSREIMFRGEPNQVTPTRNCLALVSFYYSWKGSRKLTFSLSVLYLVEKVAALKSNFSIEKVSSSTRNLKPYCAFPKNRTRALL